MIERFLNLTAALGAAIVSIAALLLLIATVAGNLKFVRGTEQVTPSRAASVSVVVVAALVIVAMIKLIATVI